MDRSSKVSCIRIRPASGAPVKQESGFRWLNGFIEQCGDRAANFVADILGKGQTEVSVELPQPNPVIGETIAVLVTVSPPRDFFQKLSASLREPSWKESLVTVTFGEAEFPAYPTKDKEDIWRALVPTTPLDVPGPRSLVIDVRGMKKLFCGVVDVGNRDYPFESVWLSEAKSNICETEKEREVTEAFRSTRTSEQLWSGPFNLPTTGPVTTDFGVKRSYNGVFAERYFHRGIDYGADEGTPVKAPARGRVVLVGQEQEDFQLHGNCVGLDHGQGVTSIYMHLSSVAAVEGTTVEPGQVIGAVGQTGLATGPHLHWGLHVHGKAVDPSQWMRNQSWL